MNNFGHGVLGIYMSAFRSNFEFSLCICFVAEKFGLPSVPPYFGAGNGSNQKFSEGVNFAVAGATALDNVFLAQKGIFNTVTNVSLEVQMGLFKQLLPSLCSFSSGKYSRPVHAVVVLDIALYCQIVGNKAVLQVMMN